MLDERASRHPDRSNEIERALVHVALGDLDHALSEMDAAAHKRVAGALFSVNGIQWRALRADDRFWALAERHGLAQLARGGSSRS